MPPYLQDEAHQNAVKVWKRDVLAEAVRANSKNNNKKKKKKKSGKKEDIFGPQHPGLIDKVTRARTPRLSRAGPYTHTHTHTHTHLPFHTC